MNKNKETIKKVSAKVHEELLNTSHLFIDETVATLSRMQRITGKVIKKSEPILEKQIEITFDAVEAIKDQAGKGGKRALKLLGLTKQYNKLTNTIAETIDAIPSAGEVIEDAKEFVGKAKTDVEEKIGEIKKMGIVEKTTAPKSVASKTVKKAVAKVKTAKSTKKKVVAKSVSAAKSTAKKAVKATKSTKVVKAGNTAVKTITKQTSPAKSKSSELTQINGIGPSLAAIMTDNGIKSIVDLQKATPTALKIIATKAGNRYKSFDTKKWITAAKAIAK